MQKIGIFSVSFTESSKLFFKIFKILSKYPKIPPKKQKNPKIFQKSSQNPLKILKK